VHYRSLFGKDRTKSASWFVGEMGFFPPGKKRRGSTVRTRADSSYAGCTVRRNRANL
jgi:hypothetical protein